MAVKKQKTQTLYLHCKCQACKSWEIIYKKQMFHLHCVSCNMDIPISFDLLEPHPLLHWEAEE